MKRFRNFPIQQKMLVMTLLICGAVLLVAVAVLFVFQVLNFRSSFQRDNSTLAALIANQSTAALAFDDRSTATEVVGSLQAKPNVLSATLVLPEGDLFVFMFNPFSGPIFDDVANHLAAAAREPRPVVVAYNNDKCGDVLERTGAFRRVRLKPLKFWTPPTMSIFYNDIAWKMRNQAFQRIEVARFVWTG